MNERAGFGYGDREPAPKPPSFDVVAGNIVLRGSLPSREGESSFSEFKQAELHKYDRTPEGELSAFITNEQWFSAYQTRNQLFQSFAPLNDDHKQQNGSMEPDDFTTVLHEQSLYVVFTRPKSLYLGPKDSVLQNKDFAPDENSALSSIQNINDELYKSMVRCVGNTRSTWIDHHDSVTICAGTTGYFAMATDKRGEPVHREISLLNMPGEATAPKEKLFTEFTEGFRPAVHIGKVPLPN